MRGASLRASLSMRQLGAGSNDAKRIQTGRFSTRTGKTNAWIQMDNPSWKTNGGDWIHFQRVEPTIHVIRGAPYTQRRAKIRGKELWVRPPCAVVGNCHATHSRSRSTRTARPLRVDGEQLPISRRGTAACQTSAQRDVDRRIFWHPRISDGIYPNSTRWYRCPFKRQTALRGRMRSISEEIKVISVPLKPVAYPGEIWSTPSSRSSTFHLVRTIAPWKEHRKCAAFPT